MASISEIEQEIMALQKQAETIRLKEYSRTIADIQRKMELFRITMKDLADSFKTKPIAATKSDNIIVFPTKFSRKSVAATYLGPNGETWSGRGRTPKWMSNLIAAGQSKESFAVKN